MQERYFQAVYADFTARISLLAELLSSHRGEQGRYVESVVRDLLREFLPARYALGTGFIIDSLGGRSDQCDIVVYDAELLSGLFGRTGPLLFPVEVVYGVIEVKLSLDSTKLKAAVEQIASVKRLASRAKPVVQWRTTAEGGSELVRHDQGRPLGVVFGYRSDTSNVQTLRSRTENALSAVGDVEDRPDLVVSPLRGLLRPLPRPPPLRGGSAVPLFPRGGPGRGRQSRPRPGYQRMAARARR